MKQTILLIVIGGLLAGCSVAKPEAPEPPPADHMTDEEAQAAAEFYCALVCGEAGTDWSCGFCED